MSEEYIPSERSARPGSREAQLRAEIRRERFYDIVMKTIEALPQEFQEKMENVDVVVADWPSPFQLARTGIRSRFGLLGLYEGVPRTKRDRGYGMVLPDKITIFRKGIEARCHSWSEIEKEIVRVVRHEIAHHFGIGEQALWSIESRQRKKGNV